MTRLALPATGATDNLGLVMVAVDEPHHPAGPDGVTIRPPDLSDGAGVWRVARDSRVLDLNSSYAYLLWTHDFAATSSVALDGDEVVGFITGYRRPQSPDTVVVWQIAVAESQRGRRLGSRLLHELLDRLGPQGVRWLATTISPSNEASIRMFSGVARDRGARIERHDLFGPEHFPADEPGDHEPEHLYLIGRLPDPSS